jgi:hypothetical protein
MRTPSSEQIEELSAKTMNVLEFVALLEAAYNTMDFDQDTNVGEKVEKGDSFYTTLSNPVPGYG